MRYFPLFLRLAKRRVLVVGGGEVAARKIELLLDADANIRVVAPRVTTPIRQYHRAGEIEWLAREFRADDVNDAWLVICAVADAQVRDAVLAAAHAQRLHVNVVDRRESADAIVPALVTRDPVQIAIGSGGAAPVLARRLRERIECWLPPATGALARFIARRRDLIRRVVRNPVARRHFHERLIDGPVGASVAAGRAHEAVRRFKTALRETARTKNGAGKGLVSLVGAGPGDPELLTLKALRRLQQADVIVHDGLVNADILKLARRDAQRIDAAKRAYSIGTRQQTINRLLRVHSLRGHDVVRLKGGDPFVFGRGGEELEYLRRWQIPYEVVPGITAAAGCAAYAGIPLTHRDHAGAVSLVGGQRANAKPRDDWRELARVGHTLVFYMSVARLADIRRELRTHGLAADTPIALVENGTLVTQRVIAGRLDDIDTLAERLAPVSPALLFVGATAALATSLHWFGAAPIHANNTPSQTTTSTTGALRQ